MKTRNLLLLFALVISMNANLCAQVTIGSANNLKSGAILDLNNGAKGGLLLSNVNLPNFHSIPGSFPGIAAGGQESSSDFAGAMVYHTGDNPGVYVWNGENWTPMGQDCRELAHTITLVAPDLVVLENKGITISVAGVSPQCAGEQLKWYRSEGNDGTGSYQTDPFAITTGSTTLTLTINDFPPSLALYKVKVEAFSPYSPDPQERESPNVTIAVGGCPAKISATEWLFFQCNNLGGAPVTSAEQVITRAHHGDWYRFGAKTPSLENVDDNSDKTPSTWDDNTPPTPYYQKNSLDWDETDHNPCPAGWRLPTSDEWLALDDSYGVVEINSLTYLGDWSDGSFTRRLKIGDYLYLPAAGCRGYINGVLIDRGIGGYYWSKTTYSTNMARNFMFENGSLVAGYVERTSGYSVRCVSAE